MFVSTEELYTHLYPESIRAISGNDERLLLDALSAGEEEVRGYLHKFDLDKLFGAVGGERNALLVMRIKDVAVWHYINIAVPQIDYDDKRRRYEYSIAWLKGVQKGEIVPNFPPKEDDDGNKINTGGMLIGSNPKRGNHI